MQEAVAHQGTGGVHGSSWARRIGGERGSTLERIRWLADLLDTKFQVPGLGVRFGYDALLGLVPVVGDTLAAVMGAYIVGEAMRLGVRKRVLVQMGFNVFLDWLVGLIPLVDLIFDVAFKANARNARLILREAEAGRLREAM